MFQKVVFKTLSVNIRMCVPTRRLFIQKFVKILGGYKVKLQVDNLPPTQKNSKGG